MGRRVAQGAPRSRTGGAGPLRAALRAGCRAQLLAIVDVDPEHGRRTP